MKPIVTSGKRKRAVARAVLREGKGNIKINRINFDFYEPKIERLRIKEVIMLAGDAAKSTDIDVTIRGGGFNSQAEAARLAIARAFAKFDKKLEKTFLEFDRLLLVADVRRKETHKPNRHGKARAKRQKSYR